MHRQTPNVRTPGVNQTYNLLVQLAFHNYLSDSSFKFICMFIVKKKIRKLH